MVRKLRNLFFKIWYWYISVLDKNGDVVFMNFGYSNNNERIVLSEEDEINRYSIQLYHHTVSPINLKGLNILEVGCGRGGGLSYINNNMAPNSSTGVDISNKAIQFCKKHYKDKNMSFFQCDAQMLTLKDNHFDVVINIESSHRYPRVDLFFNEVFRVLKPGGYFLFTDFRKDYQVEELESQLRESNLIIESKKDITDNVLEALTLSTPERIRLIKKLAPKFLHELGRNFSATVGTPTYIKFQTRKILYLSYVLMKPIHPA